jgi:putative glutamine amidotransferase
VLPLVAIPGRRTPEAKGLRTEAVAAGEGYIRAVRRAGGEPLLLAPTDDEERLSEVLGRFDGLLMLGGGDVDPGRYGTEAAPEVRGVDTRQDAFEVTALQAALALDLPVFAICRGLQLVNVAHGGSLHQHIEGHRFVLHPVRVEPSSRLAGLTSHRPVGHSVHHQSVDRLGAGLVVTARADDGTIEGIERPDAWLVAVQWHPEDTAADDPAQQSLFDALAERAGEYSTRRPV